VIPRRWEWRGCSAGFSPRLPRRPDAVDLALVILSVAIGVALVLVSTALFIQMVR
jgi:hypothetical protein